MSNVDPFQKRLAEARQAQQAEAFHMVFDGFPCTVISVPYTLFITSGRMPDYLTRIVLAEDAAEAKEAAEAMTTEEVIAGEKFMRHAVCKALVSPRVIPEGVPGEGEYLYADLLETSPAFISAVFRWIMRGCPKPKEEKGEEVLGVEDLANFSESAEGQSSADAGDTSEGGGAATVGVAAAD